MHDELLGKSQGLAHQAAVEVAHGQMRPLNVGGALSKQGKHLVVIAENDA